MKKAVTLIAILLGLSTLAFADVVTVRLQKPPRPEKRVGFPEIRDWNTLRIKLQRGACMGMCPVYRVEIDGDGNVSYEGHDFVAVSGKHRGKVSVQAVRDLYARFKKADFFWLFDSYRWGGFDAPAYTVSISFDRYNKYVFDDVGTEVGMPRVVRDLEDQIDAVAVTKKWTEGTNETFAALKAEGWDFRSSNDSNAALLLAAVQNNQFRLAEDLLKAGASARGRNGCLALAEAAENRNAALIRKLLDGGAPASWRVSPGGARCDALAEVAGGGRPLDAETVQLLLEKGADPYAIETEGKNTLENMEASGSKEAVSVLKRWMANHPKKRR